MSASTVTWRDAQKDPPPYDVRVLLYATEVTVGMRERTDKNGEQYLDEGTDESYLAEWWAELPEPPKC